MVTSADQIERIYLEEAERCGVDNVALLTPFRQKTETGVTALNERLRDKINPPSSEKTEAVFGKRCFRKGDKVMQIKNYEDISNGDIGYVVQIRKDGSDALLTVDFGDGRVVEYENNDLDMLTHLQYESLQT